MRVIDRVLLVLGDEAGELLDGGDDDADVGVFQLPLQHRGGRVGVGRAFLEALVLAHGLVVQILAIHHEQHLVDVRQPRASCAALKLVSVLPLPVVCQM
jgi:hypothetical protein